MSESTPGFVVKATTHGGQSLWVSRSSVDGIRTLVFRERADVFATQTDAQVAIAKMPRVFRGCGYVFTVQVAD
jgi:hypothetical protein